MTRLTHFDGQDVRQVFIETGMGDGDTLRAASLAGFEVCHSIEFDRRTFDHNAERFAEAEGVMLHFGRAVDILPLVIDPSLGTLFWLDAHYSGGSFWYDETHADLPQCELLGELGCINAVDWQVPPTVLVDDAFMFEDDYWESDDPPFGVKWRETFRRDEWPTLPEIMVEMTDWKMTRWGDILRFDHET